MSELNFCRNLFLTALRQCLLYKMLKSLKPFKSYVAKTIFSQRHNKILDWNKIENSLSTRDKNHPTQVSESTQAGQLTPYKQPPRPRTPGN